MDDKGQTTVVACTSHCEICKVAALVLDTLSKYTSHSHLIIPVPNRCTGMASPAGNTVTYHALRRFRSTKSPIQKYLFLRDLQLFNPRVYFHLLMTCTEELLPFIYTPTVGEACQTYHQLPMLTQVSTMP